MSLLRAELRKLTGNPMLIGFTVWVFPVGIGAFVVVGILLGLFLPDAARAMATTSSGSWITDAANVWRITSSFPANVFGRLLPLAFMATAFAGEYAWGTLRQVLPRSPRWALLVAKSLALVLLLAASFLLTSLINLAGQAGLRGVLDMEYGPALSWEAVSDFSQVYGRELLLGLLSLLILVGMAALAAVLTRSILGGLLASFGLSVLEPMSFMIFLLLQRLFDWQWVMNLYRLVPTYNLDNTRSWLAFGEGFLQPGSGMESAPSLTASLVLLGLWILLLMGAAIWIFQRQDISE
jgi:ABC-type transport system involved in multi-copper enzyme maturation permease subunit